MKKRTKKMQRGFAIVMVLIVLAILGVMTAEFVESNQTNLATTVNARDAVRAEYLARSGVNLSRLLLSLQPLLGSTLNFPIWQYADLIIGMFTDPEGGSMITDMLGINFDGAEGIGLGMNPDYETLEIKIIDEDSKINLNAALTPGRERQRFQTQLAMLMAPMVYDTMFDQQPLARRTFERPDIICELIDWVDGDEELCDGSGGEDPSMYQQENPPYERKNAPFDSLEEAHLVGGIGDDFWSAFVDPDPTDPDKRVMTVWGKGKINVNTATAQVLFPMVCMMASDQNGISPCIDPMTSLNLLQILQAVVMMRNFMPPFSKASDFVRAIENPEAALFVPLPGLILPRKSEGRRMLTTKSTVFSIYATAKVGNVSKRIHVVVDTENQDMFSMPDMGGDAASGAMPALGALAGALGGSGGAGGLGVPGSGGNVAAAGGKVLYWRME